MPQTCTLCGAEDAIEESHVLSEFMYLETYDTKHRAVSISNDPSQRKPMFVQKGIREPLLGLSCEAAFSRYEHYAAPFLARAAQAADAVERMGTPQPVAQVTPFD